MGEAKRRKALDPTWGKTVRMPKPDPRKWEIVWHSLEDEEGFEDQIEAIRESIDDDDETKKWLNSVWCLIAFESSSKEDAAIVAYDNLGGWRVLLVWDKEPLTPKEIEFIEMKATIKQGRLVKERIFGRKINNFNELVDALAHANF